MKPETITVVALKRINEFSPVYRGDFITLEEARSRQWATDPLKLGALLRRQVGKFKNEPKDPI